MPGGAGRWGASGSWLACAAVGAGFAGAWLGRAAESPSALASYITGQTIHVNGGIIMVD